MAQSLGAGTSIDPLTSWNEGAAKKAIMEFVAHVTQAGGSSGWPMLKRIWPSLKNLAAKSS
jgi:hypothetical protein